MPYFVFVAYFDSKTDGEELRIPISIMPSVPRVWRPKPSHAISEKSYPGHYYSILSNIEDSVYTSDSHDSSHPVYYRKRARWHDPAFVSIVRFMLPLHFDRVG